MRDIFGFRRQKEQSVERKFKRLPLYCWILMAVGALTVLYFLITYVLIPFLAMLTVS